MIPSRVLRGLAAGFLVAAPCLAAGGLNEEIERFESLRLSGPSAAVNGLSLTSGHLTLVLRSGNAAPVAAGEEVLGLFFVGEGTLEYRSADAIEHPVTAFNTKKNSGVTVEKATEALILRSKFQRLLWVAPGKPSALASAGAPGPDLAAAFGDHSEKFGRALGVPMSHRLYLRREAPSAALVCADVGGSDNLRYVFDDFEHRSESLSVLRKSDSSDSEMRRFLWPVTLSEQPIGRDRRVPPTPHYALTDVRLDIKASGGKDVELTATETIVAIGRPRTTLRFDLYDTRWAVVGGRALEARTLSVQSVRDGSGRSLRFHHSADELLVGLAEPAQPDRPIRLEFKISGDFLVRPGGDNYWLLGVGPWFPQPELAGQYYTLDTTVRVPKPFIPFAPGTTRSRRTEGDRNILETTVDKPVQFAVVIAGKYAFQEETRSGVTVRVATYAMSNPRAMRQLIDLSFGIIEYYQNFLGPFPFPEFNIVEINAYGFGQAPPGVMFITSEAFNPYLGELNQLFSQGVNERFAHEIAHQYWGHVVKMPSEEEQWLTEAFAEYSAAVFLKAFKGQSTYNSLLKHWTSRAKYATETAPIPLANRVSVPGDPLTEFSIRFGLLYDKGSCLLAALHRELGDQMFFTFMKSYQKSLRWKFGSTQSVAGLLEFLTKKDYKPFFEEHFWGTAMPPK